MILYLIVSTYIPMAAAATAAFASSRLAPQVARRRFPLPSVSFSGAGFLGCYHVGVAACLVEHGHLLRPGEVPPPHDDSKHGGGNGERWSSAAGVLPPILTGVSAGSIVSAGLSAGVRPEESMDIVLTIARRTREAGGALDVLRPGYSLVDQIPDLMLAAMRRALGGTGDGGDDYDRDLFRRRIRGGEALRIGLTDRRKFSFATLHTDLAAYCYVDEYRDIEDAVAASVISSFIPGLTGTVRGASCPHNEAVRWAWGRVSEMGSLGYVKDGRTGKSVQSSSPEASGGSDVGKAGESDTQTDATPQENEDLRFWDGGLANLCPTIDDFTVMVAPLHGSYSNPSISPPSPEVRAKENLPDGIKFPLPASSTTSNDSTLQGTGPQEDDSLMAPLRKYLSDRPAITFQVHERILMEVDSQNLETLYRMTRSSDDDVLEERFRNGYDDARRFLKKKNMLTVLSC